MTARPRPADSPAHSLARRALVDRMRREERDGLRCLRYPAARAPVGVSSSRRAVCARYCGRTLHGPKVRPEKLRALLTAVGYVALGTPSVKGIAQLEIKPQLSFTHLFFVTCPYGFLSFVEFKRKCFAVCL